MGEKQKDDGFVRRMGAPLSERAHAQGVHCRYYAVSVTSVLLNIRAKRHFTGRIGEMRLNMIKLDSFCPAIGHARLHVALPSADRHFTFVENAKQKHAFFANLPLSAMALLLFSKICDFHQKTFLSTSQRLFRSGQLSSESFLPNSRLSRLLPFSRFRMRACMILDV